MTILAQAESRTDRNPTGPQKAAGNYSKGRLRLHGLEISIESPRGSTRKGVGPDGKSWSVRMPTAYGYIKRTVGADNSHVDCFVGPHLKSPKVFVIDQHDPTTGDFDEHKTCLGFGSRTQAVEAYARAFSDGKGKRRIGHVESMSIEKFKDWLRGDTKKPVRRAAGGGVQWDDGGTDVQWDAAPPPVDNGKMDAVMRGAASGATFNLDDELAGAHAAGPKMPNLGPLPGFVSRTAIGAGRVAYDAMTGKDPDATSAYEKRRDEVRKGSKEAKAAHPYLHMTGEFAGAIPGMAMTPGAGAVARLPQAAGKLSKYWAGAKDMATQGGIYGGITGAGGAEGLGERALEGAKGVASGIVGGVGAHALTGIGRAAYDKFAKPIVGTVRGWVDPSGEMSRRVGSALQIDQDLIKQGKAQGMPWADWVAARQRGEPVTLADLGSASTQSLLRSAANTSPEARAQLEKVFEERFLSQTKRVGDTVRSAIPGGTANARKTGDQLLAEYDVARVPAYKAAYRDGDRPLMSDAMGRLMGSDTFLAAMKKAISTGKDRDIEMGLGGFNPMVSVTQDGRIVFNKGAQGAPTYPNLQYWDQVKRELDSVANQAKRSGDTASSAGALAKILRGELDAQVKTYAKARGVAENFFGESSALEAGRALAGKKIPGEEIAQIMRKMDPQERALFQEGYASDLAERVIGRVRDGKNITKQGLFDTPEARKTTAAVFGPGGMKMIEARMALETIMNGARDAMGGSTTARQLIEAGLAGGAVTGYATGWDPVRMLEGAGATAGARYGAGASKVVGQMATGASHLIGKVDAKVARGVAELLTSDDPRKLMAGLRMAAGNEEIRRRLFGVVDNMAMAGQAQARQPVSNAVRSLQGPVPGRAEEEQQRP